VCRALYFKGIQVSPKMMVLTYSRTLNFADLLALLSHGIVVSLCMSTVDNTDVLPSFTTR